MSLEEALDRHSAAIEKLCERLSAGTGLPVAGSADKPAKRRSAAASEATPDLIGAPPEVSYEELSAAILACVNTKGHPTALKVLQALGVKHAKDLRPEQYGDAVRHFRAA